MITISSDAVLVFAAIVFTTCMAIYVGGFIWMRRQDREDALTFERLERRLDDLLRR